MDKESSQENSNASFQAEEIYKVAHLARLKISKEELEKFTPQLQTIFENFTRIAKVNTEGVEPLVTPTDIEMYLREDTVENFAAMDEVLTGAPEKMGRLFKVPPVV